MRAERVVLCGAITVLLALALPAGARAGAPDTSAPPPWAAAAEKGPMTAAETRDCMKRLAQYVYEKHLKKDEKSPQRGMVYEYLNTKRIGEADQFVEGEALDTMHDGAWLAAAMVNAGRATGDPFYKEFLARWQVPFYCLMLNHSDTLFSAKRNDAYTEPMLWRYFCDVYDVPPGINRGDLFGLDMHDGTFDYYQSDPKGVRFLGSRMGPQNMIASAWALQLLKARPGIWEERYKQKFSSDLRVILLDPPPGTKAEKLKAEPATIGAITVNLLGLRGALMLCGTTKAEEVTIRIFSRPDAKGTHAAITLKKGESVKAVNDKGEALLLKADLKADADGMGFDLLLPYTVTKGQKPWANGIEHGRYSIQVGDAVRNFYLASREDQVKAWLEREVGQGLRVWDAIFRQYGYIPTHIGRNPFWDGLSDSGGYAHLISAGAEWLLYLDGKNDWDVHHVPATK